MKVLNFEDPGVVQRFKHALAAASLNPLMQQMLMSEAENFYLRPTTIDNPAASRAGSAASPAAGTAAGRRKLRAAWKILDARY